MFVKEKRSSERLADAADLVIDFATLGEYGLEPVSSPRISREGCDRRVRTRPMACTTCPDVSFMDAIERFSVA